MERHAAATSRLQAPSARAHAVTTASTTAATGTPHTKRGSSGGSGSGGGTVPFGYRRASAATGSMASPPVVRRVSREGTSGTPGTPHTPPRLALHELQPTTTTPPPTATFLKRGTGRTIATLGNPTATAAAVMTPPPRRKSGSPRATMNTPTRWNSARTNANANVNAAPLRARHGSRDAVEHGNKMGMVKSYAANGPLQLPYPQRQQQPLQEPQQQEQPLPPQQQTPLSPDTYLRQRKRSADMMDPTNDAAFVSPVKQAGPAVDFPVEPEEIDDPPLSNNDGDVDHALHVAVPPMTPPPRNSVSHDNGELLPVSPPDSKRQKRLTRSPKTPLGSSNYETEEGRLSATQRVRLSLSGYMTVASLNTAKNIRRESVQPPPLLLSNGDDETASADGTLATTATTTLTPQRSSSTSLLNRSSSSSLGRSKFTTSSRSLSGSALQIASALLPSKNSVDCLMGYIRELQKSEATLRVQLENVKKQRHDEHTRSTTLDHTESAHDRERRQLEEQEQLIETLKAEVAELHYAMMTNQSPQSRNGALHLGDLAQQQYPSPGDTGYFEFASGSSDNHPASSYVTPPPSRSRGQQYLRAQPQQSSRQDGLEYEGVADSSSTMDPSMAAPPTSTEWTEQDQTGYYNQSEEYDQYPEATAVPPSDNYAGQEYYQYQHASAVPPSADYTGQEEDYQYAQDPSMVQATTHASEWAEQQNAPYDGQGNYYDNHGGNAVQEYPAMVMSPSAVPMSPVAKLDPSRSSQDSKIVPPQVDVPPMFRVAPRLSDIVSPMSRSVIAAPMTADHNVLKPVTPQALTNARQPRYGDAPHPTADQAFVMTPAPLGPPRFNMSGFHANPKQEVTPPKEATLDAHAHPVPDHVPGQEEQFVPAEQVFKPFHKPKTPTRKAASPAASKRAVPLSKEAMKELLVEFFTGVDKSRVRMAEGYSKRYHGQEPKLFVELTRKYGEKKVDELQRKFEKALNGSVDSEEIPLQESAPTTPAPTPMTLTPSPEYMQTDHAREDKATVSATFEASCAPPPVESGEEHANFVAAEPPLYMPPPTPVEDAAPPRAAGHMLPPPPSMEVSLPPPAIATTVSQKVSPRGLRRGPPMPFGFEDSPMVSDMLPPPPQVSVAAPPTMTPPPPPAASEMAASPPLPPRPPRVPPPPLGERSPARNATVLRQRGSSQRPPPLAMGNASSPPRLNASPVTLESLLLEFYRKHQPDRLKNVPEVVRQYTGKERELISLLKQKYGALSIKRLEQNLELLETQSGVAAAAGTKSVVANPPIATNEKKPKARGCLGRLVFFLLKLILIRLVTTVVLLGGFVALDHQQCMQQEHAVEDCTALQRDVDAFEMSSLLEYVPRVESRVCFCDEWRQREDRLFSEPSVAHVADLVKLVPFGRTIVEPVWLEFVDAYLPNLPYGEFYQSYAKPTFLTGKEGVVAGIGYAKTAYTAAAANMPNIADQWTLLVDMYNEVSSSASPAEDTTVMPSSVDMLTNAAKASKALVESTESKSTEDVVVVPVVTDKATAYQETENEVSQSTDASVEVVVEQTGLDISYTETVHSAAAVVDQEVTAGGAIEETIVEEASVETVVPVVEEEFDHASDAVPEDVAGFTETKPVDIVEPSDDADETHDAVEALEELPTVEEQIAAIDTIVYDDQALARDDALVKQAPVIEDEVVAQAVDAPSSTDLIPDDVMDVETNAPMAIEEMGVETDQQNDEETATHGAAEVPEVRVVVEEQSVASDSLIQDPVSEDSFVEAFHVAEEAVAVVSSESMDLDASSTVQTEPHEAEEGDHATAESAAGDVASENAVELEMEEVAVIEAATEAVASSSTEKTVAVVDAVQTTEQNSGDPTDVGPEEAAKEAAATTASDEHHDADEHAEEDEDLGFFAETDGLDLLELLDLADVAAADIHSIK